MRANCGLISTGRCRRRIRWLRPLERTAQQVALNPHIKYGRSDRRGYMLVEVTPKETRTRLMGLDEVRDPRTAQRELAGFRVVDGKVGVEVTSI